MIWLIAINQNVQFANFLKTNMKIGLKMKKSGIALKYMFLGLNEVLFLLIVAVFTF